VSILEPPTITPGQISIFDPPRHDSPRAGASHHGDPSTSRDAARANFPRAGSQRHVVLLAVVDSGARGLTAEECAEATGMRSGASGNSAAKRLSELRKAGYVRPTGTTRKTANGCDSVVCVATPKALEELSR
jgi:hypothetical protein